MKALWTEEEAQFHGEFVNFDPVWSYPKPTQRPHPPILLGGETDHTLQRVVEFCDGWFPRTRARLRARCKRSTGCAGRREQTGRDPRRCRSRCSVHRPRRRRWPTTRRPASTARCSAIPDDSRDEILRYLDKMGAARRRETLR